ncbi:hypothetical protein CEXT_766731 [Caerostris extrusa]|uniref:Uncharacterized protein n=1 Tax=Caerostris extrusa TaxID=172846 RepID=A0AAV4UI28_CAEEX|nr:hypothetical protein CEXT_766731 [Caerostris extrusa]
MKLWLNGPFYNLASLFKCDPDSTESHPLLKEIASKPRASQKRYSIYEGDLIPENSSIVQKKQQQHIFFVF